MTNNIITNNDVTRSSWLTKWLATRGQWKTSNSKLNVIKKTTFDYWNTMQMDSLQQKQQALVFEHSCWEGKWGYRNKFTITKAQQQWQRQKTHNHHLQQKLTLIEGWVLVPP